MTTESRAAGTLADETVLLALQEITEDLARTAAGDAPLDAGEAEALVGALLGEGGGVPRVVPRDDLALPRRLLDHLAADPDTGAATAAVLADPPADDRLGVETALAGTVALAALVGWLQTKVEVRIKRRDGKTEFEFRLSKAAAPPALIRELAATVSRLLSGPVGGRNELPPPENDRAE
ncbi:hypothetical protein [Actinomadura chibensis]|uniref:Uncharacterized protein n=1 Tax=Actinomadura chibensis TaxID=392828 RepID=A0A5D0NMZ8_9ACTN|nr:hypothetical protein [Actinomadura chibensis]TYB45371.1 hypothetical protein FXF69_18155 [Actinomadura chibensis]